MNTPADPLMRQLLLPLMLTLLMVLTPAAHGLDTSAGVGLQDRALFQETVDFTLTNQDSGDFHGQNLANTSFAGAVGRRADFSDANLHGAILTQGAFAEADFRGADLSDLDRGLGGGDQRVVATMVPGQHRHARRLGPVDQTARCGKIHIERLFHKHRHARVDAA